MILKYSIINRLVEEYFDSEGITKEAKILSAFFLMSGIKGHPKDKLKRFRRVNHLLKLSVRNFKSNNPNLANSQLKLVSKLNEENLAFVTTELGNLDPVMQERMRSSINFDFRKGFIGIVEDY